MRDALTVDQLSSRDKILTACFEVTLDHHTDDAFVSARDLAGDFAADLDLAQIVLLAVRVAEIDHDALGESCRREFLARGIDAGRIVVGLPASTKNDVTVFVAHRRDDCRMSFLGYRQEVVCVLRCPYGIDSDTQVAIGAVFESYRTRQAGCEFAMDLAFGRARADSAPAHEVRDVLRRDDVEVLHAGGHSHFVQLDEKLSACSKALVDLEAAVKTWIVDQSFPSDGCPRLFEVHAHHDEQIGLKPVPHRFELLRVLHRGFGIVDGTRSNDDEKTVVCTMQDAMNLASSLIGNFCRSWCNGELIVYDLRREEFLDFLDTEIVCSVNVSLSYHFRMPTAHFRIRNFLYRIPIL